MLSGTRATIVEGWVKQTHGSRIFMHGVYTNKFESILYRTGLHVIYIWYVMIFLAQI